MEVHNAPLSGVPPIATTLVLIQLAFYYGKEYIGITSEDMVYVSWDSVITKGQYWRLLIAHFCNFHRAVLWLNCFSLISIGRYVERKVQKGALIAIIQVIGITSNLLYILLNSFICTGQHTEHTYGFNSINYAIRFWLSYLQEPRNYERSLLFGFWALDLPTVWSPWPMVAEIFLLKFLEFRTNCMTSSLVGVLVGGVLTWLMVTAPLELWRIPTDQDEVNGDDDDDDDPQPRPPQNPQQPTQVRQQPKTEPTDPPPKRKSNTINAQPRTSLFDVPTSKTKVKESIPPLIKLYYGMEDHTCLPDIKTFRRKKVVSRY